MGKAISHSIKVKAEVLMKHYPGKFSPEFEKNKAFLKTLKLPLSKKTLNLVTAFISRQLKKQAD